MLDIIMSTKDDNTGATEGDLCCASCGIAQVDEIELTECPDCQSVRYCSDKCREEHRQQHDEECKKRVAELRDEILFRQPESTHLGDCPICFLPLSPEGKKSMFYTCCCKMICNGCIYANIMSNKNDEVKAKSCVFCRTPMPNDEEETIRQLMKRIEANDPAAMRAMGAKRYDEEDYNSAFEYLTKAAELGDFKAHYQLGGMYERGEGVEKDEEKEVYHYEKAAVGGHPYARHNLACVEERNGNVERAVKHLIIAANLGFDESMKGLWTYYADGFITKDDLEAALRAHKVAVDATKSPEREAGEEALREFVPSFQSE